MPKIKLGAAPKTFKHPVKYELVEGGTDQITMVYTNRTRDEFAAFIDGLYPELKEIPGTNIVQQAIEVVSVIAGSAKARDNDVSFILGCAQGWDLDDEFNGENVRRLVNEFPAAARAVIDTYRVAITEGRLKN